MAQVDSKERQLSIPEIVSQAAATQNTTDLPIQTVLVAFVQEASMPNTEVKQYGNTVFITHFSKDKDLAVGRAINMDTANNFVYNGTDYLRDLVRGGTTKFVAQFAQKSFAAAFAILKRTPVTTDMKMWIVDTPKGETQVRIALDGELT
jgi:hypothetical protein